LVAYTVTTDYLERLVSDMTGTADGVVTFSGKLGNLYESGN